MPTLYGEKADVVKRFLVRKYLAECGLGAEEEDNALVAAQPCSRHQQVVARAERLM
ncbi:MAG: hypothetical protein ABIH46_06490 [Chloroflexota bacterium]